ncbi:UDP-D-xylose:L-fucose alpha-1,3-D-xylosyltransferase 3-like [Acanthaster planci]|uniref:UDP-D-xylose:L-fucose alpha-1,3-D-xylosyltransferase 3-like n=1 Tax=Acanthaster planci TaxID=133434 RepID=A0A8B7Z9Z0_ACAPL|nr:UDP-D-xylose:L-fucose alpha-1,3-D-xylosyltransferase 3-like [Acanthaster planci]XP_022100067.1 UDP-D-xylose:L-fucose alpha-1,3-D-xylosyltransferase 3-like [Acanthaster planci]
MKLLSGKTRLSLAACAVLVVIIFSTKQVQRLHPWNPRTIATSEPLVTDRKNPRLDSMETPRLPVISSVSDGFTGPTAAHQPANGNPRVNPHQDLLDSGSSRSKSPAHAPASGSSSHSTPQRRVVLTTTNSGFLDFTENVLRSIVQTGAPANMTIVAEDEEAFRVLSETGDKMYQGLHVIKPESGELPSKGAAIDFGTNEYVNFINRRAKYVLGFIQQGFDLFFVDVDTYWFRDPFPYFEGDFDVALIRDSPKWGPYNGGCMYYRPTERTVQLLKTWIRAMETQTKHEQDQAILNQIIRKKKVPRLRIRHLLDKNFPGGRLYATRNNTCFDMSEAVVFHATWIPGHDKKMEMMKKCGMWLDK